MPSLVLTRALVSACMYATLALGLLADPAAAAEKQNVLVLAGRDSQQPAYEQFMSGFRAGLSARGGEDRLQLYTEFFDFTRFPQAEHRMRMRQFLQEKYAATRIDLLISTSPDALDFVIAASERTFPERPLHFCVRLNVRIACAASAERRDWHSGPIRFCENSRDGTASATAGTPSRSRFGRRPVRQDARGHCPARAAGQWPRARDQLFVGTATRSASRGGRAPPQRHDRPVPDRVPGWRG